MAEKGRDWPLNRESARPYNNRSNGRTDILKQMGGPVNRLERFCRKRPLSPVTEPIGHCMSIRPVVVVVVVVGADRGVAPPPHKSENLGPVAPVCVSRDGENIAVDMAFSALSILFFPGGGGLVCFAHPLPSAPLESHVSRRRVRGL